MFGSRHDYTSLICDIGSATVSATIVRFSQKAKPVVLTSVSLPLSVTGTVTPSDLEFRVFNLLEQSLSLLVSQEIPKLGGAVIKQKNVDHSQVVLSSPWYVSKATRVMVTKEKAFKLDEGIFHDALNEQEKIFETEVLSGNYQTLSGEDIHMIEREVLSVSLNGYDSPNPYNKRARYAELSLYMSVVPQKFLKKVDEIIKRHFHIRETQFHTSPLVFFRTIPSLFPHESDALLVEVSGESTQVSFVVDNSIVSSNNFSHGRNTTMRAVMNKLGVTQEIALSSLRLKEAGTLDKDAELNLQNALSEDGANWVNKCVAILTEGKKHATVPTVCFFLCDEDVSVIFLERLKNVATTFGFSHIIPVVASVLKAHVALGKFAVVSDNTLFYTLYFTAKDVHSG